MPTQPNNGARTVATYRGTAAGWQPIRVCADRVDAERFAALVRRIRPDYVTKVR